MDEGIGCMAQYLYQSMDQIRYEQPYVQELLVPASVVLQQGHRLYIHVISQGFAWHVYFHRENKLSLHQVSHAVLKQYTSSHSIVAGKITEIDILQNSKTFRGLKVHSNRMSSSQQS